VTVGGQLLPLTGALAGGLFALAAREAVIASPAAARWLAAAIEPLRRAGREGYAPSALERRRLAVLGALAAIAAGWLFVGLELAVPLAVAGPGIATWTLASRRRRYRRGVERSLPEVATAIADSLAAGRSLRAAIAAAPGSLDGAAAVELSALAAELAVGEPTAEAIERWQQRMRSPRVDSFAAALLSQRLAGGDLSGLLRRFAAGAAERDRVTDEARTATAQARFTGLLVVAMPSGAALFAELIEPGFLANLLRSPASAFPLVFAAALQLAGFVAIRRFARVVD
jgi:tight adherence protein B